MAKSTFVYVTYIRTTPEALWRALTDPEITPRFWLGVRQEADWAVGGAWRLVFADGRVADAGEVLEIEPLKRLVLRWQNQFMPEMKAEGWSRCEYELESGEDVVKLTVTHSMDREGSKFIGAVSNGWPQILSNLKSLLETGKPVVERQAAPQDHAEA
jgi:uncharacterized protein YndB with AHSA1/START domain